MHLTIWTIYIYSLDIYIYLNDLQTGNKKQKQQGAEQENIYIEREMGGGRRTEQKQKEVKKEEEYFYFKCFK